MVLHYHTIGQQTINLSSRLYNFCQETLTLQQSYWLFYLFSFKVIYTSFAFNFPSTSFLVCQVNLALVKPRSRNHRMLPQYICSQFQIFKCENSYLNHSQITVTPFCFSSFHPYTAHLVLIGKHSLSNLPTRIHKTTKREKWPSARNPLIKPLDNGYYFLSCSKMSLFPLIRSLLTRLIILHSLTD